MSNTHYAARAQKRTGHSFSLCWRTHIAHNFCSVLTKTLTRTQYAVYWQRHTNERAQYITLVVYLQCIDKASTQTSHLATITACQSQQCAECLPDKPQVGDNVTKIGIQKNWNNFWLKIKIILLHREGRLAFIGLTHFLAILSLN